MWVWFNHSVSKQMQKLANSVDPDQTAPMNFKYVRMGIGMEIHI